MDNNINKTKQGIIVKENYTMQPIGSYMFLRELKVNPLLEESKEEGKKFLKPKGVSFESNAEGDGQIQQLAKIFRLGEVLAVGDQVKTAEVGDLVYFDDRNSVPLPLNAEEYIIRYPEQHALAIIKKN